MNELANVADWILQRSLTVRHRTSIADFDVAKTFDIHLDEVYLLFDDIDKKFPNHFKLYHTNYGWWLRVEKEDLSKIRTFLDDGGFIEQEKQSLRESLMAENTSAATKGKITMKKTLKLTVKTTREIIIGVIIAVIAGFILFYFFGIK